MHSLQETVPRVLNFAGLPYVYSIIDEADYKESCMFLALSWYHYEENLIRRPAFPAFPSWTWAGWAIPAYWWSHRQNNAVCLFPLIQDAYFVSGESFVSLHSNMSQELLSKVTAIQFSASLIPAEAFTTKESAPLEEATRWGQVQIYNANVVGHKPRLSETPKEYQKSIQRGVRSCLILGFYDKDTMLDDTCMTFLVVVEWEDDLTAVRMDGMRVWGGMLSKFCQMLKRRTVRLM
jgi:hypothetical protein